MPDFGPVGGCVQTVAGTSPVVVETQSNHGLADGDRVRIQPDKADGTPLLAYVKCSSSPPNAFVAYDDATLKTPTVVTPVISGAKVARLAVEDWAVISGINYYPAYGSLNGPVRDASLFADWLKSHAFVPDDQVKLICSPKTPPTTIADATPTLEKVKGEFENLARRALAMENGSYRIGRRLYIFLSGHGILPTRSTTPNFNETALLMANSDSSTPGNHLGGNAYAEWFRAPGVFEEVILFVDCCRDQKDNVTLTPPSMPTLKPERPPGRRFYAAATQSASKSWEKPLGSPLETRGVFSYVLMEALRSNSLCDPAGLLTGSILAAQLYKDVPRLQDGQDPDIDFRPAQDIAFVKRLDPKKPRANITFDAGLVGKTVDLIGKNYPQADATHVIDGNVWVILLDPVLYKLEIKETGATKLFEIDAKSEVTSVTFP